MLVPCSSSGARRLVLDHRGDNWYMFRNRLPEAVVGCLDANGGFKWPQRTDAFPIYFQCSASNSTTRNHMQTWKWDDDGLISVENPHALAGSSAYCLKRPYGSFGVIMPLSFVRCGGNYSEQDTGPWLRVKKYAPLDI